MNDSELTDAWIALEPSPQRRRRIDARVRAWLEAREISLAGEWLGLIKRNPIVSLGFAAVSACLVLVATPLSLVAFSVL